MSQLGKLTGVPVSSDHVFGRLGDFFGNLDEVHRATAMMGVGTLVLILVLKRTLPGVPAALVGVVLALVVTWVFGLEEHGIAVVGDIDAGAPWPAWPDLPADDWLALVGTAAGVALVGYADSILTARGVADRHGYMLDANRELSGLGVANAAAGLCQGMPLSSTGSGTAAMSSSGANSSLGGIIAAAFVAVGLVAFPGVLEHIPQPALAAVVAAAAIGLVEVDEFQDLWTISRIEFAIAVLTALSVVVFDVLIGIVLSVALSLAIAVYRIARPHDAVLGDAAELDGWVDVDAYPQAVIEPGLLVYRFDAPLFFTNAGRYCDRVVLALRNQPGTERWVVLDLEGVGSIDATAAAALRRLVDDVGREGVEVIAISRANRLALDKLGRAGLLQPDGPIVVFATINGARAAPSVPAASEPPRTGTGAGLRSCGVGTDAPKSARLGDVVFCVTHSRARSNRHDRRHHDDHPPASTRGLVDDTKKVVRVPRRTIDKVLVGIGTLAVGVLAAAGGLLTWGSGFCPTT